MKLVKEHIYEKFSEESDPITDMGIGIKRYIKDWLKEKEQNIAEYKINHDLTVNASRINFYNEKLIKFPDYIQFNNVYNNVCAYNSDLKTLKGFPKYIGGNLYLGNNKLKNLKYITQNIVSSLYLFRNELTTLKNCPSIIHENFCCSFNFKLKSLDYMPKEIGGDFICYYTGMSDSYIEKYLIKNNIIIKGQTIITKELAKQNKLNTTL